MSETVKLNTAIQRGALELRRVHCDLLAFEGRMEAVYARSIYEIEEEDRRQIQNLDAVLQAIESLAGYFDLLSEGAPPTQACSFSSAINAVKLEDVAQRLRGNSSTKGLCHHVELF